jgi:peroxiredoxin Q/BCP
MKLIVLMAGILSLLMPSTSAAEELKVGDAAPLFALQNQDGAEFALQSQQGKRWTVLYFYPKAETPGCTKQACAFRDSIDKIRALNAEVYGVSADEVEDLKAFQNNHRLSFDLLADPDGKVIRQYGAKMPVLTMAKRWTFIIDPDLKIRAIERDVDPLLDAKQVAEKLQSFQNG